MKFFRLYAFLNIVEKICRSLRKRSSAFRGTILLESVCSISKLKINIISGKRTRMITNNSSETFDTDNLALL